MSRMCICSVIFDILAFDLNGHLPEHAVCASSGDTGEGMYCRQNSESESLLVAYALVSKSHV